MRCWAAGVTIVLLALAACPATAETDRSEEIEAKYPACALSVHGIMLGEYPAQQRIAVCTAAIESNNYGGEDLALFYFNRSTLRNQLKQYTAAQSDVDSALRAWPHIVYSLIIRAEQYNVAHQFDLALADLTKAQPRAADAPQLYFDFATTYLFRRDYALARANVEKDIELQPDGINARLFLAEIESIAGDNIAAIAAADASVALGDTARSYTWRCMIRTVAGMDLVEKALPDCNTAIQISPDYPDALNARGMLYERLGRHREAIADFDAAMTLTGRNVIAIYGRALAEKNLGEKAKAAADFAFAKYLSPDVAKWFSTPEMFLR